MNIVYVHGHVFNVHTWSAACGRLEAEGIRLHLFSQQQSAGDILEFFEKNQVDIFIGHLFHDLPRHAALLEIAGQAGHRIGLGMDMPPGFSSFSAGETAQFENYMKGVSAANYVNGIKFLVAATGEDIAYEKAEAVKTSGIYHPDAPSFYDTVEAYLNWRAERKDNGRGRPIVGILCYYGQIMEKNCADIDAVVRGLERHGFIPLCVYGEGVADSALPLDKRYPWMGLFKSAGDDFAFLLNLMAGRLLARAEDTPLLESLNIPVVQLIRLHHQTLEEWENDPGGLGPGSHSMVYSLAQPEMSGAVEPTLVAASVPETDERSGLHYRRFVPVTERIDHLCRRLTRWQRLKETPTPQRRLTIVLNNNPCKGVEATLGLAAGLDTFESLVAFMKALKTAGYDVGDPPQDGKALLNLFLEKKAISEFRWTTADEIVKKGGVLHHATRQEYEALLESLPPPARTRILDDWGPFPGEGMVYPDDGEPTLLVTGLQFGNLKIMVQPKRGCYGAKCNGEVCRILHDPELSPPPYWLATYRYIRETSDAVVHFGTHGALEFLPGKRAALSNACFPEVTLGDLPNVYLYVMDVPGDGLVAKRRASAVMVDHLTPVQRPAVLDEEMTELENLLDQYRKAMENGETKRQAVVAEHMRPLMKRFGFVDESYAGENFEEKAELLSRQIARCKRALAPLGMHLLGTAPGSGGIATMLATILIKPTDERPPLDEIATWIEGQDKGDAFDGAREVIQSLLDPKTPTKNMHAGPKCVADLKSWCKDVAGDLAESEIRRMASFRVFSSAPGTAGTGVGLALDASAWETDDDLAETYINWAGYAYGSDHGGRVARVAGMQAHQIYADNLKHLDVSYMRQYSPEYDLVDCGCYTGFLGGMSAAAKAVSGNRAKLYWADTNAEGDLSVRDLKDDIAASVRAKLFNKNWIKNQKDHGYKGAGGVSSRVNNLFKWSATTRQVEKWVFDAVVETYIRDKENLEWLRQNNPYALEEITRRLMEAQSRGLWAADADLIADVQEAALTIEGDMEETMGEVTEEFQGAKVDVLTAKDVDKWKMDWRISDK